MPFVRTKSTVYLLLVTVSFCFNFACASQFSYQKNESILVHESVEKFRDAAKTIVSLTKDRVLVNKNGFVQSASLHNFFLKKKNFPLVLLLQVNGKEQFLTYESCITVSYGTFLRFLENNDHLEYNRVKIFVEFSEKSINKKFSWTTVCSISNKLKIAQIDTFIDWPIANINGSRVVMGFSVSKWAWKKNKIASMLKKNGDFISFW